MSTSFVFKGNDVIVGFNFDNKRDLDIKIKAKKDLVYGVYPFDESHYAMPFGVNRDGGFSNVLKVPPSLKDGLINSSAVQRIDSLSEDYLQRKISFEQVAMIAEERPLVNPPDISLHSQLSDRYGRVLILEPGRGVKIRDEKYSIMANFSFFEPLETKEADGSGYDRYQTAGRLLSNASDDFSVDDAFALLEATKQENGDYVTLVSFVYSAKENKAYWKIRGEASIHNWQF